MKKILKTIGLSILFLILFLVLTFPFDRLAPKARKLLESNLNSLFGISASCALEDFDLKLPLGLQWSSLVCIDDINNQKVIDLGETSLTLLPKYQSLNAKIGKGSLDLKANAGFSSPPTRVSANFSDVPVERVMPLLMGALNRAIPYISKYIKADGKLQGSMDWPLKNFQKEKGKVDLQFINLKFPTQNQLDMIGLKELNFSKGVIKLDLASGKLNFTDVAFISQPLSGKADGQFELADDLRKSVGNLALKWKVEKSDALLSSYVGPSLANNCPSPDSEGFCTRRIQRAGELGIF